MVATIGITIIYFPKEVCTMKNYKEYQGKVVTLMLCSACNINCKHCYISFAGNRTIEELDEMIPILLDKGYRVDLNGAEVLTNPNYLKFYKMASNKEIMTNGISLFKNPMLVSQIIENNITTVGISYHFELHDIVSEVPKEIVLKAIQNCIDGGVNVLINTTISTTNYDKVEEMCERAISIGAKAIRFTNFVKQGNVLENGIINYALNQEQIDYFFKELNEMREKYDKDTLYINRSGLFDVDVSNNKSNFVCTAGYNDVTITPNNMVYPCIFLAKEGFEIGVYEDGIVKLYDNFFNDGCHCCAAKILNKGENMFFKS